MTEHCGIWVGLPITSSKDMAQNTQATFDWVSNVDKVYLGYLCFIFYQKWTRLLNERTVSSSNTIRSLATIRTATMYIFFYNNFEGQVTSRARHTARSIICLPVWVHVLCTLITWVLRSVPKTKLILVWLLSGTTISVGSNLNGLCFTFLIYLSMLDSFLSL